MTSIALDLDVDTLLGRLWQARGSDLLLTAGAAPLLRVDGGLHPAEGVAALTPADTERLALGLLNERQREQFAAGAEVDFSFTWRDTARVRGNAFRQKGAVAVALRVIPRDIPSFDDIRLPWAV